MLYPTRNVVLALVTYVVAAFLLTVALGDLGDVGFWIVWIPVAGALVYLGAAGVALLLGRTRRSGQAT